MRDSKSLPVTSAIIVAIAICLVLSFFILTRFSRAGQSSLVMSVNVAATAQTIRTQNRQSEIEAALKDEQQTWESKIAQQQQTLENSRQEAQAEILQLESQLLPDIIA